MNFQISKYLNVGTNNPIVARLMLGLPEIIRMAEIPEGMKDSLVAHCFAIAKHLIQAEKAAQPLIQELREIVDKLRNEGVRVQGPGVIETPGVMHLDDARVFLKYAKQALQELAASMGLLLGAKFKGPHFHKVRNRAIEKLGLDHVVSKLLEEDQAWIKNLIVLRDEDEHPVSGRPFVRGFEITLKPDGGWHVDPPRFFNNEPVFHTLEVLSHNLLTFSEELLALTLCDHLPNGVALMEIPEEQRKPDAPRRYGFGVKGLPPPP